MKARKSEKFAARNAEPAAFADAEEEASSFDIPNRCRAHYVALAELRERLLGERYEELAAAAEPIEARNLHQADSATDEFDHELALGLLSARQDALYEIDAALARIREGTYGICEITGRPISEARLRAVPWTRYTEQAGEELEKSGQTDHTRRLGPLTSVRGEASHQLGPSGQVAEAMGGTYAPETPTRDLAEIPAQESREESPAQNDGKVSQDE
jgi:RNA polymerase-binding transcription factor DksA